MIDRFDPSEELNWYPQSKETKKSHHLQNTIREFYKLDYLYFWLFEETLVTSSKFDEEYLDFVENHVKKKPIFISEKELKKDLVPIFNKWYFENYKIEQFLEASSKFLLAQFHLQHQAYTHQVVCAPSLMEIQLALKNVGKVILKNEFGFAGRGNLIFSLGETFLGDTSRIVLEKFLDRVLDFSILWIDERKIIYQNSVSAKGQYQGSLFEKTLCDDVVAFLLKNQISEEQIFQFLKYLKLLEEFWRSKLDSTKNLNGVADFFIFKDEKNFLHIHPCCEFNPRWSMGRVSFLLFKKIGELSRDYDTWSSFRLDFCNENDYLVPVTKGTKKVLISPKSRKPLVLSINF